MREWIDLFEKEVDDPIDRIIKNSSFSRDDIDDATCGLCGTFVLSLYRFLKKHGIHSEIYALSDNYPDKYQLGNLHWTHIILEVGNNYYDIRGKISLQDAQQEFGTRHLYLLSEKDLVLELWDASKNFHPHYSWKKYKEWGKRLQPVEEEKSTDFILYHGTSEPAELIRKQGLKGGRHNAVFLTDNPELAIDYAISDQERTGLENVTLVSVSVNKLNVSLLVGDIDHTLTDDWEHSLKETDQCMYLGDIFPQIIKVQKIEE